MPTYSYNPERISENGVDRMRFELGDTTFAPGELTAALSDEEYEAVINEYPTWKKAKIACLTAILMKYSHQVDTKIGPVSYNFSERVAEWRAMRAELKAESKVSAPVLSNPSGECSRPYFHEDMHRNPRKG